MITGMWFSKRVSTSERNNIPYLKESRRCGDLLASDQKKIDRRCRQNDGIVDD